MRVFKGNLGQTVIFEGMLRGTGRVVKVQAGQVGEACYW